MRKSQKISAFILSTGLALSLGTPLKGASQDAGTTAGQILNFPGEVRGASMGEAYSACANDISGIWYNPATIARSPLAAVSLMHNMYVDDIQIDALGASLPLKYQSAAGFGFIMTNPGSIESLDNRGNSQGSYSPRDMALTLAIAKMFNKTSLGLSGKLVSSKIQNSAQTFTFDAGIHQEFGSLSLALAAQNFGGALKFNKVAEPLPRKIRLGSSWNPSTDWLLNLDYIMPQDRSGYPAFGTEYNLPLRGSFGFALRGGYNTLYSDTNGLAGVTAGAGFALGETNINYAWIPFGELGQTHRLSLLFQFQNPLKKDRTFSDYEQALKGDNVIRREKMWTQSSLRLSPNAQIPKPNLPVNPWKKSRARPRTADEKIMAAIAKEALCPSNGPHAMATRVQGNVQMKRSIGNSDWEKVERGQYFFEGDKLETKRAARAQLFFANGSEVEVGPNTLMEFEPSEDVCALASFKMANGDLKTKVLKGKDVKIITPLGATHLGESLSHVSLDDRKLLVEIIEGEGEFNEGGKVTPLLSGSSFSKESVALSTAAPSQEKISALAKKSAEFYFPPASGNKPGRWDPQLIEAYKNYMKELNSIEGITVSEYLRDKKLRDDFKTVIQRLELEKADMQMQSRGYENDIKNFQELRKKLAIPKLNESRDEKRDRKMQRVDVTDALKQARENFKQIQKELTSLMKDIRINQDAWAAIPIVRLINITAKESTIPFPTGASVIPEESGPTLNRIAEAVMKINPSRILVEGHTDKIGRVDVNIKLSKKRAAAVAKYLREKTQFPGKKFTIKGMGPFIPIDEGDSPESLAKNRRVEIWLELKGL